jgi:hypothetical protein
MSSKMFAGLLGIAAMFGMAAPLAHADGPAVGSGCAHAQSNEVTTASDGTQVRCTTGPEYDGWIWLPDTGVPAPDPPPDYLPLPGVNLPPPGTPGSPL